MNLFSKSKEDEILEQQLQDATPQRGGLVTLSGATTSGADAVDKSTAVEEFAKDLLARLAMVRQDEWKRPIKRPIIFICHSMGGMVVKKAIIIAHEQQQTYTAIADSKLGIVFLATPQLGLGTNTKLPTSLCPDADILWNISSQFAHRATDIPIKTFYETDSCLSMSSLVVEKDSAVLFYPNETALPMLNTNHHTISRFSHRGCQNYALMRAALQDLQSKVILRDRCPGPSDNDPLQVVSAPTFENVQIKAVADNEKIQQFYKSDYMGYKASVKPPIQDTCLWFLQDSQFIAWLESPLSSLLWVSGDPGCGKTTLAAFLINRINQRLSLCSNDFIVTYFFFDANNLAGQVDGTALLYALIHQLLQASPALIPLLEQYLAPDHTQSALNLQKLCEIFRAIVSGPERKPSKIVCVVDAIDECEEESMTKAIEFLTSIVFDDRKSANKGGWLKVAIISRYNQQIDDMFGSMPEHHQVRLVEHAAFTSRDIETFIRARCVQVQTVTRCSDNMRCAIEKADERSDKYVPLDGLYNRILQRTTSRRELLRILSIIAASQRPLTLDEIDVALAVRPDDVHIRQVQHRCQSHPDIARYLYDVCGPFIRIWNGTVSFIHQTANEFLLRSADLKESPISTGMYQYKACLNVVEVNQYLAEICVVYLTLDDTVSDGPLLDRVAAMNLYGRGSDDKSCPMIEDIESLNFRMSGKGSGLFDYAAKHWGTHCRLGNVTSPTSTASCQNFTIFTKAIALCDTSKSIFRNWFQLYWNTISTIPEFPDGLTPLMLASHMGLPDVMRSLLLGDSKWNNQSPPIMTATAGRLVASHLRSADSEGWTALHWAVWNGHGNQINNAAIEVLLQQLQDEDHGNNPQGSDCHHNNYECNPDQQFQTTETCTSFLDIQDNKGLTALHWAAADDQTSVVRLLLEAGAAVDVFDADGMTPLLLAYENGFVGPVEVLVEYDADINIPF
ncbi:heterokaryon incompatibility protein het-E-1 [Fusarium mundagurra]|uniref:Heterokaryon incompatibility protein het-E-1 n=1 Tax=Fusarium mundagurra TaxID=1567541 RepID=A0A8H5Z6A3_9HYPO|nr:heterokaryon incompatibility protein het-E-1 [Fusarium mundagurra]